MKCIMCNNTVEFPEFTSLCNSCDKADLKYANSRMGIVRNWWRGFIKRHIIDDDPYN